MTIDPRRHWLKLEKVPFYLIFFFTVNLAKNSFFSKVGCFRITLTGLRYPPNLIDLEDCQDVFFLKRIRNAEL